ncbi:MAG: hypothetical protein ABSH38_11565 [Verrucomicrobiota bacterium]|jgi:hypothetical protein
MTAQAPATKASGASALLASVSPHPPPAQPSAPQDFSAVILRAVTSQTADLGLPHPPPIQPSAPQDSSTVILRAANSQAADSDSPAQKSTDPTAPAQGKAASPDAADPDPSSLLLALLAQALPVPPPLPEGHESVVPKPASLTTEATTAEPADLVPKQDAAEGNPAKTDPKNSPAQKTLASATEEPSAPTPKPSHSKESILSYDSMTHLTSPTSPTSSASSGPTLRLPPGKADSGVAEEKPPVASPQPQAPEKADGTEAPPTGTSAATSNPTMNFRAERNEIAGPTEQKLPPAAVGAVTAVNAGGSIGQRKAKPSLDFTWHDTPAQDLAMIDPSAKAVLAARETGAASSPATGQLAQIEQLISREVVIIREKGADSLGVSLKVDANTQLFLQLTNHNGQLQASLRCERGDFSALDTQWTQLQQALARQNVQLMPPGAGASSSSQQPSDPQQRRLPQSREEAPAANVAVEPAQSRTPKHRNRSRQRWESWA